MNFQVGVVLQERMSASTVHVYIVYFFIFLTLQLGVLLVEGKERKGREREGKRGRDGKEREREEGKGKGGREGKERKGREREEGKGKREEGEGI